VSVTTKRRERVDVAPPAPGPITALREVARRAGRYAIQLGDATIAPLSVETIADLKLKVGVVLDAPTLARVLDARAATACYDHAIDALARRARATGELERWLAQREHPRAAIAVAVDKLTTLGLLDDARFARGFVGTRGGGRLGPRRIERELRQKGVPSAVVTEVMREFREATADSGAGALEAAAERRLRSLRSLEPPVARRRLLAWLLRRGFDAGPSSDVVRRLVPGR
jgi:SOS response regulatory protein OraA/RecX